MPRPYFSFGVKQLEELFRSSIDDVKTLKSILAELEPRQTPKAVSLRGSVAKRINEVNTNASVNAGGSKGPSTRQTSLFDPPPPRQFSMFEEKISSTTSNQSVRPKVGPPARNKDPAASTSPEKPAKSASARKDASAAKARQPPPRPSKVSSIRAPGPLAGLPSKRLFEPKKDVEVKYDRSAGPVAQFVAGLQALITEMRKKGSGSKQIVVENGRLEPSNTGGEAVYRFPYEGDGDLFEGAKVQAVIGGRQSEGRIAQVFERQILISLDSEFGPHIGVCLLRIDNTAMLDALRERLETIAKGEVTSFNSTIAAAVLRNEALEPPVPVHLSAGTIKLNARQTSAANVALENRFSYIWGPPGTGKTQLLSAICKSLFESQKRVLICSNTNQAVDQVLFKLCELLGENNQAVQDGKILRIGRIALDQLEKWRDYVTLDGIVDRLGKDLRAQRDRIEEEIRQIDLRCAKAARVIAAFLQLDRDQANLESAKTEQNSNNAELTKATAEAKALIAKISDLNRELGSIESASPLTKVFKRSRDNVEKDLQKSRATLAAAKPKLLEMNGAREAIASRISTLQTAIASISNALRPFDRRALEKQLADAEAKKAPLTVQLSEITAQLNDIAKTVMERAMIVGATATKLYLSPQVFAGFDTVVIDEASMLMLPALFHAAGLAKERVIVSGDFRQLPPIITTDQEAILDAIGGDVFTTSGISKGFQSRKPPERAAFLDQQHRMADPICALISGPMYRGDLHTSPDRDSKGPVLKAPFHEALTIVDTSTIGAFANRDPFGSRYNLMHALAIRNLVRRLDDTVVITESKTLGICSSYSAQAKLHQRILKGEGLDGLVSASTVHRLQGDEKQALIIDIPDGLGERTVGVWLEADGPNDDGAKLFNVAISRAKEHLIVFANLEYLDSKLPARALLRGFLHQMQAKGSVLDARDILAYYPMLDDIKKYGLALDLDPETLRTGLFNQRDFDQVWLAEAARAQKSIVIFSGFITPQRVSAYGDLLRKKISEGVTVRCVTRPPQHNGSIPPEDGKAALDALEMIGCIVDTRWDIHEKAVILDGEIIWFGSLNPLSHTGATSEMMGRFASKTIASQVATFLAIDQGVKENEASNQIVRQENPVCPSCGGRSTYRKGKFGPFWECEDTCGWRENFLQAKKKASQTAPDFDPGPCPKCGKPMVVRSSSFGPFFGCSDYPRCDATVKPGAKLAKKRRGSGGALPKHK